MNGHDLDRARSALFSIPPDLPRPEWVKAGMGAHAAGLSFDDFDQWSATSGSYKAPEARATWRSFKLGKGVGEASLFGMAQDHGWRDGDRTAPRPLQAPRKAAEPQRKPAPGTGAAEVWGRGEQATNAHPYVVRKGAAGVPLHTLRVLPEGDPLRILGVSMAGALVVPCICPDGSISTLQFVTLPEAAAKLKEKGATDKPNLPGAGLKGWFTVGEPSPGGTVFVCEGIATAWACWQATGAAAVVCFGWGRVRGVAEELRQRDASARLVLMPDKGKEAEAEAIARDVAALFVPMPADTPDNFDANDYAAQHGGDALEVLLSNASEPPKPEPRFKLLGSADLRAMPPLVWRVRGVLPAYGLASVYGPSASGKSFLVLDMAAAIAEGREWFGYRVKACPVVYVCLEGTAGFRLRVQAWESHHSRALPKNLRAVLQPFKLTEPQDVEDMAVAVLSAGADAVTFIDTLNASAPGIDENASRDMGTVLDAAKTLQARTGGLVAAVHHSGKDATKGLRGHSSLFAALDAALEVTRDGDRREWKLAKSKDGADADAHPFRLEVVQLAPDSDGGPVSSCVVRRDLSAAEVALVKVPQGGNQKLVLEALRPLFKDGRTGKPGAPPIRPCIELEAAVIAGAGRLTCTADRRATRTREAITGLVSRGVLGLNEGWLWLT